MLLLSEKLMDSLNSLKSVIQIPQLVPAYSFAGSHIHSICTGGCAETCAETCNFGCAGRCGDNCTNKCSANCANGCSGIVKNIFN